MIDSHTFHRWPLFVALLIGFLAPCSAASAADWPAFGRDRTRNAVSPETNPPTDWDVETGRNIKWQSTDHVSSDLNAPRRVIRTGRDATAILPNDRVRFKHFARAPVRHTEAPSRLMSAGFST